MIDFFYFAMPENSTFYTLSIDEQIALKQV